MHNIEPLLPPRPWSTEWRLLTLCVVRPTPDEHSAWGSRVAAAARDVSDWEALSKLAQRHQISIFVIEALRSATPPLLASPALQPLVAAARRAQLRALQHSASLIRIARAFASAGITIHELKGQSLSKRLFGNPALRQSIDIDLLVAEEKLAAAVAVLAGLGFTPQEAIAKQVLEPGALRAWLRRHAHYHFVLRSAEGVVVELHWRLKGWNASQSRPLTDTEQPTATLACLPRDLEMVDLITHGVGHYFAQLKWLADIRQATRVYSTEDWLAIRSKAAALGARRSLEVTALLIAWVFEDPTAYAQLTGDALPDRSVRRSAAYALERMLTDLQHPRGLRHAWLRALYTWHAATPYRSLMLSVRFMTSTGFLHLLGRHSR